MSSPIAAANAYSSLARLTDPAAGLAKGASLGAGLGGGGAGAAGGDFSSLLKDALGAVAESGRKSDAQTQAVAAGKSNIVDVVTAVAETEVAIDAVVAVRDRVIQAYEEIMKMPI
jgi:flagellar hook-basal body complex protein FliE